jgi:hypothetical protein
MVLCSLLDGGPSNSGLLLEPSESMRVGTSGINPHHLPYTIKKERKIEKQI